jgi:sec-independent protein translocase protein TatA
MPGFWELIVIMAIVLIVFGAGKLPQVADAVGRAVNNFKRSSSGAGDSEIEVTAKGDRLAERTEGDDA